MTILKGENKLLFDKLNLIEPITKALKTEGYVNATPIQEQAIPPILAGKDLVGCAQTGTGKTAAFAIPILQNLFGEQRAPRGQQHIKALVLAPTRELAIQIGESFTAYGKHLGLRTMVIFGGVSQNPQTATLKLGVDILVATPGRLLDLMNQKFINIHNVKFFVLDEADRMLDMGMVHDVKKIIAQLPKIRQTMLFSATMPSEISKLVDSILINPIRIEITPASSTVDTIVQSVYLVGKKDKNALLIHILKNKSVISALVFSRTKHGADKIVKALDKVGIQAQAIHGNKSQNARQLALNNFKEKKTRVLVATDIAARGIDVDELSHVINFDLPEVPETYVHRIGRTGRAGLGGVAISFCDEEEKELLKNIQKLICKSIPIIKDHPYPLLYTEPVSNKDIIKKATAKTTTKPITKATTKTTTGRTNSSGDFRRNRKTSTRKPTV